MFKIWQNRNLSSKFITDMFTIKKNGFDMFHYCLENKANSHKRPSEKSYIQKTEMQKKKETKKMILFILFLNKHT